MEGSRRVGEPMEAWVEAEIFDTMHVMIDWGDGMTDERRERLEGREPRPAPLRIAMSHVYEQPGEYLVRVGAVDEELRKAGRVERPIRIGGELELGVELPPEVMVGEPVPLWIGVPGASGRVSVEVDWGDGTPPRPSPPAAEPVHLEHVYERPGEYRVRVMATELGLRRRSEAEAIVRVHPRGDEPNVLPPGPREPPPEPPFPWLVIGIVVIAAAVGGAVLAMRRRSTTAGSERSSRDQPRPPQPSVHVEPDRVGVQRFVGEPPRLAGPPLSFRPVQGPMTIEVEES